jgi:hypothetical protein
MPALLWPDGQTDVNPIANALRQTRILQLAFLATVPLFVFELSIIHPQPRPFNPVFALALAFVSATDIGIAFSFRVRKLHAAEERLRSNSQDAAALILWRSGVIISYCFAEAVVLFGFVLKILGGPWNIAGIFFAVGVLLMFAWTPRLDVPSAL